VPGIPQFLKIRGGLLRRSRGPVAAQTLGDLLQKTLAEYLRQAEVVYEDLMYLRDEWRPSLEPSALRRLISPVLRRLLIDGDYGKAWRSLELPGEPWISVPDLDAMLGTLDRRAIVLASAPPSATVMRIMSGLYQENFQLPGEVEKGTVYTGFHSGLGLVVVRDKEQGGSIPIVEQLDFQFIRGISLDAWLESPAALIMNESVTRRDIIKYVANKRGGAHYDPSREGKEKVYPLLDNKLPTFTPIDGSEATLPDIELLSIAEALAESSDAARFCREFEKAKARRERLIDRIRVSVSGRVRGVRGRNGLLGLKRVEAGGDVGTGTVELAERRRRGPAAARPRDRLAVNDQEDQPPLFIDIATFGNEAAACAKYLAKGRAIAVTGRLIYREWKPMTAPAAPSTLSSDASNSAAAPMATSQQKTVTPTTAKTGSELLAEELALPRCFHRPLPLT
jgi:hypothetical protein